MYKVKVNDKFSFEVKAKNEFTIDGNRFEGDVVKLGNNRFHIIRNNRSYTAELFDLNFEEKSCKVKVNGRVYDIGVIDQFDQLLHQLGMDQMAGQKVADLKAPMPGLVLQVLVNDGDSIKKGDNILVLEAMKMENILKAPADGTIKTVKVVPGYKVEKNQVMIVFS